MKFATYTQLKVIIFNERERRKRMKKQCIVIGLGVYGMSVAKKLSEEGIEVLAIDKNMKRVEKASNFVTKSVCMDITSIDAFQRNSNFRF